MYTHIQNPAQANAVVLGTEMLQKGSQGMERRGQNVTDLDRRRERFQGTKEISLCSTQGAQMLGKRR